MHLMIGVLLSLTFIVIILIYVYIHNFCDVIMQTGKCFEANKFFGSVGID